MLLFDTPDDLKGTQYTRYTNPGIEIEPVDDYYLQIDPTRNELYVLLPSERLEPGDYYWSMGPQFMGNQVGYILHKLVELA